MTSATDLGALLRRGLDEGLYSGAAAGIWSPAGREVRTVGTPAFGEERAIDRTSLFDLASLTKTFTAAVLLSLVEEGRVDLDEPVARLLAVGTGSGTSAITTRMLLNHTSGLPAVSFLWRDSPGLAPEDRRDAVLATALESAPGDQYRYSCLGYIAAAAYAEAVTGRPFDDLLRDHVTGPLGLTTVAYGPVDASVAVATEEEPWASRGLVRGEVHDETCWYLGGIAGNAGLFGAVDDVLDFARAYVDDGLFTAASRALATTDQLPAMAAADYGQGLGPRIGDRDIFGDVAAFGHPGFTGTLWLAIPETSTVAVLLTNRVHPTRDRVDLDPFRRQFTAWASQRGRAASA